MNPIRKLVLNLSNQAREKRKQLFKSYFSIDKSTKILDLGSENGTNIFNVLQGTDFDPQNVYIADIDSDAVEKGKELYGFNAVLIGEDQSLPFDNKYFDIVYCSSVIEHTTVEKADVWEWKDEKEFKSASFKRQRQFAEEIIRLGKQYFVQTPNKTFPIESHTWLPIVGYLPRRYLLPILSLSNRYWVKKSQPDFNLLTINEMQTLFPDAEIVCENKLGLTKSIMAIKYDKK